ncbi:MAG: hypothetical protein FD149_1193 [Rhodospirillaceae bacterium]|nr:MAG: hypothetical protein FD149_1193 [Rhodospirillaceae bacterium]
MGARLILGDGFLKTDVLKTWLLTVRSVRSVSGRRRGVVLMDMQGMLRPSIVADVRCGWWSTPPGKN